jgi:hypothetical protein
MKELFEVIYFLLPLLMQFPGRRRLSEGLHSPLLLTPAPAKQLFIPSRTPKSPRDAKKSASFTLSCELKNAKINSNLLSTHIIS